MIRDLQRLTYDYAGNITSTTDANGGTIQYFYNSLGQVSEIKDQEGLSEHFYYDEEGNLTKHIDRNENIVDRTYNIDKNIVSVEAYNIDYELLENDKEKQIKHNAEISNALIQNNDNVIVEKPKKRRDFRKRVLDNLEKKEKGLDISENTKENISNTQDKSENNSKDERLQDKYKLNVISQRFKYNPDGTLNNAYSGNMQYNYTYNKEGLLERKSASGKILLKHTYDKNDNIKTIKDISGKSSIYSYDDADRVTLISDEDSNKLAQYNYYNNDNIKSVTLGNGVKSDYTYDGDGNVQSLVTVGVDGQVLVDYNYAYDLNGNRLEKVSSKHKNYYGYDSMNRLVDSSYDGRKESFTYDKVGNRLTKTTNNITE